ncbi:MAG TPA: hypothetical protein VGK73_40520 [Polyangiaceae bacterium]
MSVELAPRWADLVFHVLAHVPSSVPAGLYDAEYVAFAARTLGPAAERELGADVRALAGVAGNHARYAALQSLAWVFRTPERVHAVRQRELAGLGSADVDDPAALAGLSEVVPEAEVLRAAAELEAERHAQLGPGTIDAAEWGERLARLGAVAPSLGSFRVSVARALGRRGRVRANEIWVGSPWNGGGPTLEHCSWQAAHEATVAELDTRDAPGAGDDRPIEAAALCLLALRAERGGLRDEHARWVAHFGESVRTSLEAVPDAWRARVRSLAGR